METRLIFYKLIILIKKKMSTEIFIGGQVAVTLDKQEKVANIQFLPDDDMALVLEQGSITRGQLQQLRNGAFDYVANKPRLRAKSTLLRKVAHGRLSATRDAAYQLTLKVFKREGVDVWDTLRRESQELIDNIKF
jgi:hypothetical protein